MANVEHLRIIKQGVERWNQWRQQQQIISVDLNNARLSGADLKGADLREANLREATLIMTNLSRADLRDADLSKADLGGANLRGANLSRAILGKADLSEADLSEANLSQANLSEAELRVATLKEANLREADLSGADLSAAILSRAYFREANLTGANLSRAFLMGAYLREANLNGANLNEANVMNAILVGTNLENANLTGCQIYGISVWNLKINRETKQPDLIITHPDEPIITVDNLEVAQFIYLLLHNERIRQIIDTITSKVVLILGRFTAERKMILDALRDELRKKNYSPVLFDFEKPKSRDFIETVSTLAHLARFVIADFTDAKIVLEEVPHIVRNIAVPVKPLLLEGSGREPVTLINLRRNQRSLLETYFYKDSNDLLLSLREKVIIPAEEKVKELQEK